MARVTKYKAGSKGHILGHYADAQARAKRPNVDPSLTAGNYALTAVKNEQTGEWVVKVLKGRKIQRAEGYVNSAIAAAMETHRETTKRRPRKDAAAYADWVITLPDDADDELAFFGACLTFIAERYPEGGFNQPNDEFGWGSGLFCAFIHTDEPDAHHHGHLPFTCLLDGRLCGKDLVSRGDIRTFHQQLNAYLREHGVKGTVHDPNRTPRQKLLNMVPQKSLNKANELLDAVEAQAREPLEQALLETEQARDTFKASVDRWGREKTQLEADADALKREVERLTRELASAQNADEATNQQVNDPTDGFDVPTGRSPGRLDVAKTPVNRGTPVPASKTAGEPGKSVSAMVPRKSRDLPNAPEERSDAAPEREF